MCVCACTHITHPQLCGRQCSLLFSRLSLQSITSVNQSPQDKKCTNLKTQGMLLSFTDKGTLVFKHRTMPAIFNGLIVCKQVSANVYLQVTTKGAHSFLMEILLNTRRFNSLLCTPLHEYASFLAYRNLLHLH